MISENARACWCAAVLFVVSSGCGAAQQTAPAASTAQSTEGGEPAAEHKPPATVEEEYQRVKLRFEDPRHQEMLGHTAYAAVQAGEEKVVTELMQALFVDMKSSGSFDIDASVKSAGGIEPYKARIATYLTSDDVMARGTAALALAIAGDLKYVDPLVRLLRSKDLPAHLESLQGYDRGMAMMALGLLKATQYRAEIEAFKSSEHKNESEAAQAALELMDH